MSKVSVEATNVVKLEKPIVSNFVGSVVAISERPQGGKFKHATKIVTVADVKSGATEDVFITEAQWKEYGCSKIVFVGNVVNFALEECIEGKTGYKETADSVELTAHEGTYKAFARVLHLDAISLMSTLSREGIDPTIIQIICNNVVAVRSAFEQSSRQAPIGQQLF